MTETLKLKGSTRDVTSCEKCGRVELSGTMILIAVNDADEEYGDRMYFGTSCAATALKSSAANVRRFAALLDRERIMWAHERAHAAWAKRRNNWIAETGETARAFERRDPAPNMNAHMSYGAPCAVCAEFAK